MTGKLPGLPSEAQGNVWVADVSDRFFTLYDAEGLLPHRSLGRVHSAGRRQSQPASFSQGPIEELAECGRCGNRRPSASRLDFECPAIGIGRRRRSRLPRTSIDATYAMNKLHFLKDHRIVLGRECAGGTRRAGRVGSQYEGRQALSLAAGRVARMAPQLTELIRVEGEIDKQGRRTSRCGTCASAA